MQSTQDGLGPILRSTTFPGFLFTNLLLQSIDLAMGRIIVVSGWIYDYMNSTNPIDEKHKTVIPEGDLQA